MNLLFDANISWRVSKQLNKRIPSVEIQHILDFFNHEVSDQRIWQYAKEHNYAIVTNDQDFEELLVLNGYPPKVILLKYGNQSNTYLETFIFDSIESIIDFIKDEKLGILRLY